MNSEWDSNLVRHEGVEYALDRMTPAELFGLSAALRAAVEQISGQLAADDGRADEEWYRRATTARSIKRRQIEYIDDLLAAGKGQLHAAPRPELSMSDALAQVVGRGGRPVGSPAAAQRPPGKPAVAGPAYFVMAARVVLHPAMFAAIEEQAARLAAGEAGR